MKTGIIVQARMGSTRLPGKVLMDINGKPMIEWVVERLLQVKGSDVVVVATTTNPEDDAIAELANLKGWNLYRGDADDVLNRYYLAAKHYDITTVIRVTSDCPLIDPGVISEMIESFRMLSCDILSNATVDPKNRTFPRGLDTEIFTFSMLEKANKEAKSQSHREHVTLYIYEVAERINYFRQAADYSGFRWTVDTKEDMEFIIEIYKYITKMGRLVLQDELIEFITSNPELKDINGMISQKKVF